ncbi:hypothetical protein YC2023_101821 [Brassica napus]
MKSHAYARICFCASTTQVTRTSHLRLCLQAKRIRCDTQQPQIWLSDVPLSIRFNERTSFEKLPTTVRTIPTEMFRFRPYDQLVELANTGKQLPDKMGELSAIRSTITDRIPKAQRQEGAHVPQPAVPEAVALGSDASNAITCNVADQATTADDSLPGRLPREKEQVPLEENAPKKARVE